MTSWCSHNLNLSLAASSKIKIIDYILHVYKKIITYFNTSPRRESLLEYIVNIRCEYIQNRKVLFGLCKTKQSERDILYEHFYLVLLFIVKVINVTHPNLNTFEDTYTLGWDFIKTRV